MMITMWLPIFVNAEKEAGVSNKIDSFLEISGFSISVNQKETTILKDGKKIGEVLEIRLNDKLSLRYERKTKDSLKISVGYSFGIKMLDAKYISTFVGEKEISCNGEKHCYFV